MMSELLGQAQAFLKNKEQNNVSGVGVIGDLALDRFVFGRVDRISPEAPVPVLAIEKSLIKAGCAANVIANLLPFTKELALKVHLFGVQSTDPEAKLLLEALDIKNSDLHTHLVPDASRPTPVKTRFLAGSPDNLAGSQHPLLRVDNEMTSPISDQTSEEIFKSVEQNISKIKVLIIQDYSKGLLKTSLLKRILKLARDSNVFTLVDPNINSDLNAYIGADLMTPNVQEASKLLGRPLGKGDNNQVMETAAADLAEKYKLKMAIVTRSAHGLTLMDENKKFFHFPAVARRVYDVTGAGDTVASILGAALSKGLPIAPACVLALAAASVVVGKVGTATLTPKELEEELTRLAGT